MKVVRCEICREYDMTCRDVNFYPRNIVCCRRCVPADVKSVQVIYE